MIIDFWLPVICSILVYNSILFIIDLNI